MVDARESYRRELRRDLDELRRLDRELARREAGAWARRVALAILAVAVAGGALGFAIGAMQ